MRTTAVLLTAFLAANASAFYPLPANQPRTCLASVDKDGLLLRWFRAFPAIQETHAGTTRNEKGNPVPFTFEVVRQRSIEQQLRIDPSAVQVWKDGKQLDAKELSGLTKTTPVLACSALPDMELLKVAKKGTLLLIVPVHLDRDHAAPGITPPLPPSPE